MATATTNRVSRAAKNGDERTARAITISAPKMEVRAFRIRGDAPYVQNKFSEEARQKMIADQVVQRAWRELESWRERYREYEELAAVFAALDASKPEQAA